MESSSSASNSTTTSEKCCCSRNDSESDSPSSKDKKSKINLFNLRRGKSAKRNRKSEANTSPSSSKKSPKWSLKFNCTKKEPKVAFTEENQNCCKCTCFRQTDDTLSGIHELSQDDCVEKLPAITHNNSQSNLEQDLDNVSRDYQPLPTEGDDEQIGGIYGTAPATSNLAAINAAFVDSQWIRSCMNEDCDEAARLARAREIEQGVEAPANFRSVRRLQLLCSDAENDPCGGTPSSSQPPRRLHLVCPPDLTVDSLRLLFQNHITLRSCPLDTITGCHTQVDFIHCLVPDLLTITNCSFYWGKMDRYEAERLLDGKPEGTFLLRDSAQEEYLFSVSFRKYGRSLHARIEQWNHKFSFDSHDPGVYTSNTVCGLIEHYKDPSSCMFFEPMLTWPLHRNFTFSLQHLARATIVTRLTYDNINHLQLPKTLKSYLKEYHYRQKVRVEQFDDDVQWLELRNVS